MLSQTRTHYKVENSFPKCNFSRFQSLVSAHSLSKQASLKPTQMRVKNRPFRFINPTLALSTLQQAELELKKSNEFMNSELQSLQDHLSKSQNRMEELEQKLAQAHQEIERKQREIDQLHKALEDESVQHHLDLLEKEKEIEQLKAENFELKSKGSKQLSPQFWNMLALLIKAIEAKKR